MINGIGLTGTVDIQLFDRNNNLKQHIETHNRIVDTGLQMIASLIAGPDNDENYITLPTYMAIGSESTAVLSSQTKLINELYRVEFDSVVRTNNAVEFTATFGPAQPNLGRVRVEEVGLFNAESEGVMLNRCVFATVNKASDDTLIIRWTVTIHSLQSPYDTIPEDDTPPVSP